MRVGMVVENLHSTGGVERRTFELVKCLLKGGHQVCVHANRWSKDVADCGAEFRRVPMLKFGKGLKPRSFAWFCSALIPRSRYDLLHTQARIYRYDVATLGFGCHREYLRAMGADEKNLDSRDRTLLRIEDVMFRKGNYRHIITNSNMCKREIMHYYGIPGDSISVVHNGVDSDLFCPGKRWKLREGVRRSIGLSTDELAVLTVGPGFHRKGLDTVIRAIGQLKNQRNVRLLISGRGGREGYDRLASELGISDRLTWLGPTSDMLSHYAAADIFVLATRYDPFANTTMEALACGLPVITTHTNGVSEILQDGVDGLLVDREDSSALADKLGQLCQDVDLRRDLGNAGCQTVEMFTWQITAEKTVKVYNHMS